MLIGPIAVASILNEFRFHLRGVDFVRPLADAIARSSVSRRVKRFLLIALIALPLHAEVRGALRGGIYAGGQTDAVGTVELDLRSGPWSFAPAYDFIRGGYGLHAIHVDIRRFFGGFWLGVGPSFVRSNAPSNETTWNVDGGFEWRTHGAWRPFVAARYYQFRMPVFRDVIEGNGAVLSIGISRRFR